MVLHPTVRACRLPMGDMVMISVTTPLNARCAECGCPSHVEIVVTGRWQATLPLCLQCAVEVAESLEEALK